MQFSQMYMHVPLVIVIVFTVITRLCLLEHLRVGSQSRFHSLIRPLNSSAVSVRLVMVYLLIRGERGFGDVGVRISCLLE